MILSDDEIKDDIRNGLITIAPVPSDTQYQSSSVDLHLGTEVKELISPNELNEKEPPGVSRPFLVDPIAVDTQLLAEQYSKPLERDKKSGSFYLESGKFALATTLEIVTLPLESAIAGRVEGRSTLARLGLVVHMTAPTIHAGFSGRIVLEMYNFGPYTLLLAPEKLSICQLILERLGRKPSTGGTSQFQDQTSITSNRSS